MIAWRLRVASLGFHRKSRTRIWHGLRSMTFAIIMLTVILLTVIAGSFLPQDSGIQMIYQSWWFYGLNFLLMLSVVSCVSRRVRPVFRFSFRAPALHRPDFYRAGDTSRELVSPLTPAEAAVTAARALRACRYRVELHERDGRFYLMADRFRAMRLGTLVSHAGIVLMVAAIAWGAIAGWLDKAVM